MSNLDTARNLLPLADQDSGCSCCSPAREARTAALSEGTGTETFLVAGMTCAHCVASVTEELSALEGVESVDVDLRAGGQSIVTLTSAAPLDLEKVRDAVSEAGYTVVDPVR